MKNVDYKELEHLALLAELGRPLVHECNNFLNNLFLQMAILVAEMPVAPREEWTSIRREGKKLANLMQEWQRFRPLSSTEPDKVALHPILQELAIELSEEEEGVSIQWMLCPESLWLTGFRGEIRRLCSLFVRHAQAVLAADSSKTQRVLVWQTGSQQGKITMQLFEAGAQDSILHWTAFEEAAAGGGEFSLTAAACKSIVERLQGTLRVVSRPDARAALLVEFPPALP